MLLAWWYHCLMRCFSHLYEETFEKLTRNKDLCLVKALHTRLVITGLLPSIILPSKLIQLYTSHARVHCARKVFNEIPERNPAHWIAFIAVLIRSGFHKDALDAFRSMRSEGWPPNNFLLPSILKACGRIYSKENGPTLHTLVVKCSFQSDSFLCSSLINMYTKCGLLEEAFQFFNSLPEIDVVSMNIMLSGYVRHGFCREGYDLMKKMKSTGLNPNLITWNTLISGFSKAGNEHMVAELFNLMLCDHVRPDVVSWTSVISGLVQNFCYSKAFDRFKQMLREGVCPISDTIGAILPACAGVADLKKGKELHGYAVAIAVDVDIFVGTALVDMYAKCGSLFAARELFSKMPKRNTVTWNVMIFGYANNGCCREAIKLFGQMEEGSEELDHLSFTAALMASSHAGMVEHGKSLFDMMQRKYGIEPSMEHYACMVDLLGRAGNIDEAYELVKGMPLEPDMFVWGAFLGACRNHGRLELAEIASKHVVELDPGWIGGGMLMKDLYASFGWWEKFVKIKKLMRKKSRKFPGCSWMEAN